MATRDFINPSAGQANILANVAGSSGFAKPLIMGLLGKEARASGEAQAKQAKQEEAWTAVEQALRLAEIDPLAANDLIDFAKQDNDFVQGMVGDMKFTAPTKKPWTYMQDTKTGEQFALNVTQMTEDAKNGNLKSPESYRQTYVKGTPTQTPEQKQTQQLDTFRKKEEIKKEVKGGAGGVAKAAHITQTRKSLAQHFWNKLPKDFQSQNQDEFSQIVESKDAFSRGINVDRFVKMLPANLRGEWSEVLAAAENNAASMSPENAVRKALEEAPGRGFQRSIRPEGVAPATAGEVSGGGSLPLGEFSDIQQPGRRPLGGFHKRPLTPRQ